jgi:transcriptional regulator with XRE-family HTH domain
MTVGITGAAEHPVRVLRKHEHLSQRRLAAKSKVSRQTIVRVERGHAINSSTARLLCNYFGRSADELGLVVRWGDEPEGEAGHPLRDGMKRRGFLGLAVAGSFSVVVSVPASV